MKEKKISFSSNRHYGHYKVLALDRELLRIVYYVIALALESGVVLKRWREVHQILLLKDPPRCKVHRFQNITLVEGDLMFVMKKFWAKKLGGNIYKEETLNKAQYARRGQIPQNGVLNKRMSYDLQHVLRHDSF